ncbi:carbohydrate kinase [Enterobacter roggenkampii]|uniref:carbohydrate kinase n=1 Tax=Enterobacter roggenkampii TaxID=1812935 RepID=UPI001D0707B3|nr:carbohydrate kinase [Enterobacter roggenkampii]MCB7502776.1 carbohydrate kinase [Enterobacter roggenkampii]
MHRIDTPTAQKDKFGAGKNGFTRGNPQTGTPATDLDDDYFDMLQEELAGVVEATGVVLDKSKHNQLLTSLKSLLLSRAHPFADIKADGSAAVAEALSNLGLVTNGNVGRLINIQTPSVSGTYTPTTGTKFVIAKLQAAGGNGANAAATANGQVACAPGGSAGAYAEFLVSIADITNFNFTIGLPAASSSSATQGGSSSFCGVTCTGGRGQAYTTATSSFPTQFKGDDGGTVTNAGTTILTMIKAKRGAIAGSSLNTVIGNSLSGCGGDSEFYGGSNKVGGNSNGIDAKDGAGGSGASSVSNPTGGFSGGLGGKGLIQFWEYA